MKYVVTFQFLPSGARRPEDPGPLEFRSETTEAHLIPNVGDFVSVDMDMIYPEGVPEGQSTAEAKGKVKSRLFRYVPLPDAENPLCLVNIVYETTDDDWGLLVKE
jgi:hypothetical protein